MKFFCSSYFRPSQWLILISIYFRTRQANHQVGAHDVFHNYLYLRETNSSSKNIATQLILKNLIGLGLHVSPHFLITLEPDFPRVFSNSVINASPCSYFLKFYLNLDLILLVFVRYVIMQITGYFSSDASHIILFPAKYIPAWIHLGSTLTHNIWRLTLASLCSP